MFSWLIFSIIHLILLNGCLLLSCRSATVDSHMFSQYFGNCPVVTAQGRTHPVSTQFLEDIHEKLNYRLASDSPASLNYGTSGTEKVLDPNMDKWPDSRSPFLIPSIHQTLKHQNKKLKLKLK